MKLKEIYNQYRDGKLDKPKYIDVMHEKHQVLFDYFEYIKDTDVESITINNNSIYITVKESKIKLLLDQNDKRFIPIEMINFHSIEPIERNLIYKLVSGCKIVIDIGANIGWYTLNFGILSNIEKIYAFEPIPHTFEYLKKHVELNNIQKAEIFNFGFSNEITEKEFFFTKEETGSSSMANIRKRTEIEKVKCKLDTLDNFMKGKEIKIDFIKCDVEGAELFVFKGAIETIKKNKPIIFTEMLRKWSKEFNYHPDDIITLFSDLDYSCFGYVDNKIEQIKTVGPDLETTNFFFLHKNKHEKQINLLLQ